MTVGEPSLFVPKLRFPKFRDDPPWSARPLGDIYRFKHTNTLSRNKLNYTTGTIKNIHYGDIHTKFESPFRVCDESVPYVNPDSSADGIDDDEALCKEGDIVLADASEDLDDVGKAIEIVSLDGERVVAGTHTLLASRRDRVPVVGFGGQLFQSAAVRTAIKNEAHGAKVYGISAKRISTVPIPIPPTVAEQQEIADCLGSMDRLIVAERQKLGTLRRHRQGLVQQLFPRPGETRPRLRFPEFEDAPAWDEVTLETLLNRPPDYGVNAASVPFSEDLPTYIRITDINDDGQFVSRARVSVDIDATDEQYLEDGDIVLARTGASVGKSYRYRAVDGRLVHAGFLIRVRPNPERLLSQFLAAYLSTWSYWHWVRLTSERSGQPGINAAEYASMPFPLPPERHTLTEQRKIANCLTFIDAQLHAQTHKLDMLRRHKKGLLHQLFAPREQ